jgi:hypothetical protein
MHRADRSLTCGSPLGGAGGERGVGGLRLTPDRPRPAVAGAAGTVLGATDGIHVDRLGPERSAASRIDADDAAALAVAEDHETTIPSDTSLKRPFMKR